MQGNKKLNLLPQAVKNKYLNRYMLYGASVVCGLCAVALLFLYGNIGVLSYRINSLQKENAAYNSEKSKMESMQAKIAARKKMLASYESVSFPFIRFMSDLELFRPFDISILSVDSADRLANGGADDENKSQKDAAEKSAGTGKAIADKPADAGNSEAGKPETEEKADKPSGNTPPKLEYKKDLAGEKLLIRGYSVNQEAISKYIHDLSRLPYITGSQVTAIEQHTLNGVPVNIFELVVIGGAIN